VAGGFTNQGSLELTDDGSSLSTTLSVSSGVLVNAPTGSLRVVRGVNGGDRWLVGRLHNRGTLSVEWPLEIMSGNPSPHLNSGSISIGSNLTATNQSLVDSGAVTVSRNAVLGLASGTLSIVPGGSLGGGGTVVAASVVNEGSINPGTSPGILSITGNVTLGAGSTVNIEMAGPTPGVQLDQLHISGAVTLGGTLNRSGSGDSRRAQARSSR